MFFAFDLGLARFWPQYSPYLLMTARPLIEEIGLFSLSFLPHMLISDQLWSRVDMSLICDTFFSSDSYFYS